MREKIGAMRRLIAGFNPSPRLAAFSLFAMLYLAVGYSLHGFAWGVLLWPYYMVRLSGGFARSVAITLAAFLLAALYVYRLKRQVAAAAEKDAQNGLRAQALEAEFARCREEVRVAVEGRREAEKRAAVAENAARGAAQGPGGTAGGDDKFRTAKRAFARLYHPDTVKAEGFEKVIRQEIFKEFWGELESIEKGAKR